MSKMTENPSDAICSHCKMPIRIRNPSGFCDHLYYPESCEICKKADAEPKSPASKDACSPETSARHVAKVQDKRIAELEAELTDKNLPPLEWAKIHAKDREQARQEGRLSAIEEIKKMIKLWLKTAEISVDSKYERRLLGSILDELASMKN